VLERLTGPTCDAALGRRGGAPLLRRLARSGVPLVALDRAESGYRMHPLLAEALRAELRHVEPELEPCLHDRLSRWYEAEGDVELAIEHAVSARDGCRAGALLADHAAGFAAGGRADLLRVWLQRLGDAQIARSPALAAAAAVSALAHGEADIADRWAILALQTPADGVEQPAIIGPAAALVRALCAPLGVDAMIAEAQSALDVLPAQGPWRSLAHLTEGTARLLAGHADAATARLEEGARAAIFDAPLIRALCLAQLAVLALDRDDHDDAAAIATRAVSTLERASCAEHALAALPLAASALAHVQRHRPDEAAAELADAMRRMRRLDDAPAWYGALLRALLAPTAMRLGDVGDGRRLLADAARMCRQVPGAVALQGSIERTWAQADERTGGPGAPPSTLTRAELRVLRLLPSHLSFREIGAELHVSANTVKTQAHAIYRKLDARSRSEAVTHAAAAGLVDDTRLS
jgi:LuxR family maltose regulon positive regulatory protein